MADAGAATAEALSGLDLGARVEPGRTVAVAVGSRGIARLAEVVRTTVAHLAGLGLAPFIVPAMGSHGGGTAEGQAAVLAGYGITEAAVGCPVRSSMDVVEVATSPLGLPVHLDRLAVEADHVVVVNRVKPHTLFTGDIESGLAKMLLVGLGKREGAATYHRATVDVGWPAIVADVVPRVLERVSVLAGVALVENAQDDLAHVEAVPGDQILAREPALLARARALVPRLPFDDVDVVLVDQIGKDRSGTGWDPATLGRKGSVHQPDPAQRPRVRTVVVRGLTEGTAGNALGLGLAELCRTRVVDEMDRDATWLNALTSGNVAAAMVPIHLATDRQLLEACRARTGLRGLADARIVWIRSTLELGVVAASAPLLDEATRRDDLTVLAGPVPLPLDADGNLPDLLPDP